LLLPLVKQSLADCGELPARMMEDLHLEEEAVDLYFHDGMERPINRPQDPEEQKLYYSGKQKEHTIKNDVLINERCKIRFLTDTVEGKKNDKRLADESGYRVPEGSVLAQDAGFQGFQLEGVAILQPKKKPRGGELSYADKVRNGSSPCLRPEYQIDNRQLRSVVDTHRIPRHVILNMRHQHSMSGPQVLTHPWRLCNSSWGAHIEYLVLNRDGYVLCLEPRDLLAPVRKGWHGNSRHRHR
jgi:hypothetical protein